MRLTISSVLIFGASAAALAVGPAQPTVAQLNTQAPDITADRCSGLVRATIRGGKIEAAKPILLGEVLGNTPGLGQVKAPVEFCRVRVRLSPVRGSDITAEVFMPANWNRRMLGTGGGGLNGGLGGGRELGLLKEVAQGYVTIVTDAGHEQSEETAWAIGNPQKIVDYGHRANHVAAVFTKALIAAYYGSPPHRSYFHGCSNGGRDALMLAQHHPGDYDGIVAGAPALNFTALMSTFIRNGHLLSETFEGSAVASKLKLVSSAAVRKCDAVDGVSDGVIENPRSCKFDPAELKCRPGTEPASCLSTAEIAAVRQVYGGLRRADGSKVYSGFPAGSEAGWAGWFGSRKGYGFTMATQFFAGIVHQSTSWVATNFDANREHRVAKQSVGAVIDATNPDLRPFMRRGGRLLMYHGWNDAAIPAGGLIDYHDAVIRKSGSIAGRQLRLFMVPGMDHCATGIGPNAFDKVEALERWFASGTPPERITATKYESDIAALVGKPTKAIRTRPLCAWPKTAHYKGAGSTDKAENFDCR